MATIWYRVKATFENGQNAETELVATGVPYAALPTDLPVKDAIRQLSGQGVMEDYSVQIISRSVEEVKP